MRKSLNLLDLTVPVLLTLVLFPYSLDSAVSQVGLDPHHVSFFIAPSLYFFAKGLIPGVDYMTQYGIGYAPLVKAFLGADAKEAVRGTLTLLIAINWFFYATLYAVSFSFLRSRLCAMCVTFFLLFLNFYTPNPLWAPSVWPARFPLLMVTCFLFVHATAYRVFLIRIILGACIGASLFLNTETGIYMLLCTTFAYLATVRASLLDRCKEATVTICTAILIFYSLAALAYGAGTFSIEFIAGLVAPLLIYGGGFGGTIVNWSFDYNIFFNIISPIVVTSSIGVSASLLRNNDLENSEQRSYAYMLIFAMLAICLHAKWANMSLNGVWFSNAHLPVLISVWWAMRILNTFHLENLKRFKEIQFGIRAFSVLIAVCFLATYVDPRWPTLYGFRSFWSYPSLIKGLTTELEIKKWDHESNDLAWNDIELVRNNTKPGERVVIRSNRDWAYLIAAKRAPRFEFLPSTMSIFSWQVQRSIDGATVIFVDKSANGTYLPSINQMVEEHLKCGFEIAGEGSNLLMYKLKENAR